MRFCQVLELSGGVGNERGQTPISTGHTFRFAVQQPWRGLFLKQT